MTTVPRKVGYSFNRHWHPLPGVKAKLWRNRDGVFWSLQNHAGYLAGGRSDEPGDALQALHRNLRRLRVGYSRTQYRPPNDGVW